MRKAHTGILLAANAQILIQPIASRPDASVKIHLIGKPVLFYNYKLAIAILHCRRPKEPHRLIRNSSKPCQRLPCGTAKVNNFVKKSLQSLRQTHLRHGWQSASPPDLRFFPRPILLPPFILALNLSSPNLQVHIRIPPRKQPHESPSCPERPNNTCTPLYGCFFTGSLSHLTGSLRRNQRQSGPFLIHNLVTYRLP